MERTRARLLQAIDRVRGLTAQFWRNATVTGENTELNQTLERAGRVADFLELAELMCIDALHRKESYGCHFRGEYQTAEGEALRDDDQCAYVAALCPKGIQLDALFRYHHDVLAALLRREG